MSVKRKALVVIMFRYVSDSQAIFIIILDRMILTQQVLIVNLKHFFLGILVALFLEFVDSSS